MTSALNTLYPADKDSFKAFLNKVFTLSNVKLASSKIIADINLPNFDFVKSIIYATNADIEKDLQSAQSTGHKNLAFTLVATQTHKKDELIKATRAINSALPSYNIVFFISPTHLSIAFATRRFHKKRTIKEDVIEKITLIKDINLSNLSVAHQLNLQSIATIKPKEVDVYYDEILAKLSISSLNKKFYGEIFQHFYNFTQNLTLPNISDENTKRNFVLRLISRILFCKFLEKKGLIDSQIWDTNLSSNYYHEVLEPLFFTTLNTPKNLRDYALLDEGIIKILERVPYLNGGLFSPQQNDYFNPSNPHAHYQSLKIDNHYFDELFKTLQAYHFTIDEASHNAEEVALDPELLGQIFESLLSQLFTDNKVEKIDKNTLRKATGSYYTPREIVRYMVQSAILAHLQTHLKGKVNSQFLEKLVFGEDSPELPLRENAKYFRGNLDSQSTCHTERSEVSQNLDNRDISFSTKTQYDKNTSTLILQELSTLKILDPACGSGAFPMGILSEIIRIQNDLGDTRSHYERKLEILQHCIYGVDIQPMATEMARLRCFLSLIIDENIDDIKPLPNLEFKFINANSLLPLPTDSSLLHYDGYHKDIQEFERLRNEYFNSQDKSTIQKEYLTLRERITREDLQVSKNDSINNPMLAYDPFDPQSVAQFFDSAYMFGVDCFDIVIGNPPYIDYRKIDEQTKSVLTKNSAIYKDGKEGSIYVYFIEMGKKILAQNGSIIFINPISYICQETGFGLRNFIDKKLSLNLMLNVSNLKVFDSVATYTCINHFTHKNKECKTLKFGVATEKGDLSTINLQEIEQCEIENLSLFLSPITAKIFRANYPTLNTFCEIFCGLSKTGFRANVEFSKKDINRPFLEASDIFRYEYKQGKFLSQIPFYYSKDKIDIFEKDEIIFMARMTNFIRYCIAEKGFFGGKVNILHNFKIDKRYILGLLNSKLLSYFYAKKYFASHMQGGAFGFDTLSVGSLPIPKITAKNKKIADNIISLVNEILESKAKDSTANTTKLESKIDDLVFELYNLTLDEIKIITN